MFAKLFQYRILSSCRCYIFIHSCPFVLGRFSRKLNLQPDRYKVLINSVWGDCEIYLGIRRTLLHRDDRGLLEKRCQCDLMKYFGCANATMDIKIEVRREIKCRDTADDRSVRAIIDVSPVRTTVNTRRDCQGQVMLTTQLR